MIRESQPYPVTGEILAATSDGPANRGFDEGTEIEDAVFETLDPVTPSSSTGNPRNEIPPVEPVRPDPKRERAGLDVLRGRHENPIGGLVRHFRQAGGPLFWGFAVLLVASAFWISGGYALVAGKPGQAAGSQLVIADVQTRFDDLHGGAYMLVEATVENRGTAGRPIPPVIVDVANDDSGTSRAFRLPARAGNLAPGARHLFSGRIPAPKSGFESVSVRLGSGGEM